MHAVVGAVDSLWQKKPFLTSDFIVFITLLPHFDIKGVYLPAG